MKSTQRTERRAEALSKERIVGAAIEILDAEGEAALTFRTLAARLATGAGAIYWHVANKGDLLAAATDALVAGVVTGLGDDDPREEIRTIALGVFDAIDAHPWVGTQLAGEPWQSAMLHVFEGIGSRIQRLGVPEPTQFNATTALLNYILGLAGQHAAGARLITPDTDRATFLAGVAARWLDLDAERFPFVRQIAAQLPDHDDREQFLAGIDLILAGVATVG